LSGKSLSPGYAQINLGGGRFVRVAGGEWSGLSQADKAAMKATWKQEVQSLVSARVAASAEPDFDGMTMAELKAFAAEHSIDLTGRQSSTESVRTAIRAARVTARFVEPIVDTATDAGNED
jgi:hypothetical protein